MTTVYLKIDVPDDFLCKDTVYQVIALNPYPDESGWQPEHCENSELHIPTYWVIENRYKGAVAYWTGEIDKDKQIWTLLIHNAKKFQNKRDAIKASSDSMIGGDATEHMDIDQPEGKEEPNE